MNYRVTGMPDGGATLAIEGGGQILLTHEQVSDIVATREATECSACRGTFTGDNPPTGVVCEECAEAGVKARMDKLTEEIKVTVDKTQALLDSGDYAASCRRVNEQIKADNAKAAKAATGPNAPTELPAGKYLVTDPCYVLDGESGEEGAYGKCCDITCGPERHGYFRLNEDNPNSVVFVFGTAFGDGGYPIYKDGSEIGSSSVDSGQIAFIPFAPFEDRGEGLMHDSHGAIVTLDKPTVVEEIRRGDFKVGKYEVYTSDEDPHCFEECSHCGEKMDSEGRKASKISEYDERYCDCCCTYGVCEDCDEFLTEDDEREGHDKCETCRKDDEDDE